MKSNSVGLLLALLAFAVPAHSQDGEPVTIGKRMSVHSEILQEERPYWVYLPGSYDDDRFSLRQYPVLYLLDGDGHFHSASGVVQFMSAGFGNLQIPELIVVAIPNTSWANRTRDLTPTRSTTGPEGEPAPFDWSGGGTAFLRFMQEELFEHIDATYRTLPYRLLVGHSFGGLFSLYALLEAPSAFQAHIAIDPSLWWDDRVLVRRAEREMGAHQGRKGSVYMALATDPIMVQPAEDFAAALEAVASPEFRLGLRYFEDEDHSSLPLLSLYHGLLFTFDGYKLPFELKFENPAAISEHFEQFSNRVGFEILPPGAGLNNLGYGLQGEGYLEKAIEVFRLNVKYNPDSSQAHYSLGQAYAAKGEKALAMSSFERSVELNPANRNAVERLQELTAR